MAEQENLKLADNRRIIALGLVLVLLPAMIFSSSQGGATGALQPFNQKSPSAGVPCTVSKGSITSPTCTVTFPVAFSITPVIDSLYTTTSANNTGSVFTNVGLFQESGTFFKNIPEVATAWGGPNDNRSRTFVDLRAVSTMEFSASIYNLSGNCTSVQIGFEFSLDNGVTFNIFPNVSNELLIGINPPPPTTNTNQTLQTPAAVNILGFTPAANQFLMLEFVGISLPQDGHHFCSMGVSSLNLLMGSPLPFCPPLIGTGLLAPTATTLRFRLSCAYAYPVTATFNVVWSATNFSPDPVTGH